MTRRPSTPVVLTLLMLPDAPSYGRTLVIVFWWTVMSSVPWAVNVWPAPSATSFAEGLEATPRESAARNMLNASERFRRPIPPAAPPAPPRASAPPEAPVRWSSDWVCDQPDSIEPSNRSGWQSCPAATSAFSLVKVSVRHGSEGKLTE